MYILKKELNVIIKCLTYREGWPEGALPLQKEISLQTKMASVTHLETFGYSVGHIFNDICASMWFTYLLLFFQKVMSSVVTWSNGFVLRAAHKWDVLLFFVVMISARHLFSTTKMAENEEHIGAHPLMSTHRIE